MMVGFNNGLDCCFAKMLAGLLVNVKPVFVSGYELRVIWGWKDYGGA